MFVVGWLNENLISIGYFLIPTSDNLIRHLHAAGWMKDNMDNMVV
jgi:hypothetical protein